MNRTDPHKHKQIPFGNDKTKGKQNSGDPKVSAVGCELL